MILAPSLEYSLLYALLRQDISPQDIDPKTLSQIGQVLYRGVIKLSAEQKVFDIKGIQLYAVHVEGLDAGRVHEYIANVAKAQTANVADVHKMIRERQTLLDISNEINEQLSVGKLDLTKITTLSNSITYKGNALVSVTDDLVSGAPEEPRGPAIRSLPILSAVTNGLFGMWLLGGLPAVGKSTLALQIGVDIAGFGNLPTLYYDAENGRAVTLNRVVKSVGLDAARKLGHKLFIRESLRTLTKDLRSVPAPAFIVVDSIQKIGTKGDDRQAALDTWIHKFEELKKNQGYSVLLVSEIPRHKYTGDPSIDMYKETGALEYAADSAFGLVDRGPFIAVHCVKNRHFQQKGQVVLLERSRDFWFREVVP